MNQSDIQLRLYREILLVGAALSLVCIIGNAISGFPLRPSLKWIVLFFICMSAYFISRYQKNRARIMLLIFIFIIFLFYPFAFFDSGGSNNNTIGYTFLLLTVVTYLFTGRLRLFLVIGLIFVFMILHTLEYFNPEWVVQYSDWSQFVDRMMQIPLLLTAVFLIILQFSREYERVNAELDQYASLDELTGLYNRRMFNKAMAEVVTSRKKRAYLVLIDVDDFKMVNDGYGHSTGDEALKKLAILLLQAFGWKQHIVSRWGGDEFAVIFYGEEQELRRRLEEVRASFRAYVMHYNETTDMSYSLTLIRKNKRMEQILKQADSSLYLEKQRKHSS